MFTWLAFFCVTYVEFGMVMCSAMPNFISVGVWVSNFDPKTIKIGNFATFLLQMDEFLTEY